MACLAVSAAILIDGDAMRLDGPNVHLTRERNAPYDTPVTWRPRCRSEAKLGAQATGSAAMMPGAF
ncbi:hypothetical protein RM543_12235 [Roseicyclus sp. F158]|uniref:Uncharacterized protein n=1 Tax=Tropicimonas omnivorans TaxID=3075590 RepID=A0ABU3DIB1_9RHOB|nr:hypothetical protein [Roseicyclus sp. F158]MDT0683456.1 hypothetical protein [Roseicyclus sp. F158]